MLKLCQHKKIVPLLLLELPAPVELVSNARLTVLFNHTIPPGTDSLEIAIFFS